MSRVAITLGLILGYVISIVILPTIAANINAGDVEAVPDIRIFAVAAIFSWITVRIGCIKPCRVIKKIFPVEAVRYSDYSGGNLSGEKRTHKASVASMAWENIKRNRRKTVLVVLSLALSVIVVNATVSIISSFDKNLYVRYFAVSDFMVSDGALISRNYQSMDYEGVSDSDIETLGEISGVTEIGAIRMSESTQLMEGSALDRMTKTYEAHPDWFASNKDFRKEIEHKIYDTHRISSHIYGIDAFTYENILINAGENDWGKFSTGKYVIVSSPAESDDGKKDAEYAFYQIGDKVKVTLPDETEAEYEVMAIGDIPHAMGPEHSHGLDVYFTLPMKEYLRQTPSSAGAMKLFFNVDEEKTADAEAAVERYCETVRPELGYTSRQTYLNDFHDVVKMFLLIGGAIGFVLTLIGILNLINLTITSINERRFELAILRAIGMTKKQMNTMLKLEGIFRVCLTSVLVLTVGLVINHMLVSLIAGQMIMFSYKLVIWPALACIPVFICIAMIVPGVAIRNNITNN